jgi:hypothetical protein
MALLMVCAASIAGAAIEERAGPQITPPRLGFVEGDVLFWRPGTGDWETAQLNLPLADGDALATRDGKLELQIGGKSFIRAADDTQMRLESNEPGFLQLEVTSGRVAVDLRELARGSAIEVDTVNGSIRVARDGYYRIDVDSEATRVVVRRGGRATVSPVGGSIAEVATGESVEITGTSDARLTALAAPPFDEWDHWNYGRVDQYLAAPRSNAVSSDVYGADQLDQYGEWRNVETYGRVWVPSSVPAGWAPYTDGRWIWDPLYGYSWVDYAPWGWAPYHYGRWVNNGYWAWAPGPVLAAPIYSPALVAFFGGPGFGVGVGIGFPFVSWVALGWGEPLFPWWGPVGFIGSPCWWGWGGPHWWGGSHWGGSQWGGSQWGGSQWGGSHWGGSQWGGSHGGGSQWGGSHGGGSGWGGPNGGNGGAAHGNPGFRNMMVRGAVVSVPRDQFAARSINNVRLSQVNTSQLKPIQGALPVAAKSAPSGAPSKMPVPNLPASHGLPAAHDPPSGASQAKAGVPGTGQQLGGQRSGPGAPATRAGTSTAMLDAVHRGGPVALSASSHQLSSSSAAPSLHSTNSIHGQMPPPVPRGGSGGSMSTVQPGRGVSAPVAHSSDTAYRGGPGALPASSHQLSSSSAAPSAHSTSSIHGQMPPPVPRGGSGGSMSTVQPGRGVSAPVGHSSADSFARLRTQPPAANQFSRGAQSGATSAAAPASRFASPPAMSRNMASVERGTTTWGRPQAAPQMRSSAGPSRMAAPAPSMAHQSFGHSPGGAAFGGGSHGGSFGGGGFGHSFSGGMHSGGGGRH